MSIYWSRSFTELLLWVYWFDHSLGSYVGTQSNQTHTECYLEIAGGLIVDNGEYLLVNERFR